MAYLVIIYDVIHRVRTDGNRHFWFKPDLSGARPSYNNGFLNLYMLILVTKYD